MAEGVERARQDRPTRPEQGNIARLKMKNLEAFDGKSSTAFNQLWEAVTMFLGFYPEMGDQQKIVWVGTILSDTALVWHLQCFRELRGNDTWVNYAAAIQAEYRNEREAADAQLKLGQLKYQGSIRAYLTEFRALNNFARATGEGLREKINLVMLDGILDMLFNQNPDEPTDDEGFISATYRAGIQVEMKKVLKAAREDSKGGPAPRQEGKKDNKRREEGKKDDQGKKGPEQRSEKTREWWGGKNHWGSKEEALRGVPQKEQETYFQNHDDCWRCGRPGNRTFECFLFNTLQGTALPKAPWKAAAARQKRGRENKKDEEAPATKQQKVMAVETMETDAVAPLWEESDSDF